MAGMFPRSRGYLALLPHISMRHNLSRNAEFSGSLYIVVVAAAPLPEREAAHDIAGMRRNQSDRRYRSRQAGRGFR
jgi:hypothetical protein